MIYIYRFIPYLIYIKAKPKTIKLFDISWKLKVDESDIKDVLTLVQSYLESVKLLDYLCTSTNSWQYEISELELRDNLNTYNYRLSVDGYPAHYFRNKLEAKIFTDSRLQNQNLVYKSLPLYRNPFVKITGAK